MACTLVIEPDDALRDLLREILGDEGLAVRTARTETEALAWIGEHQPKLILLNERLRDMDAAEFLRRYHALPKPHAPAIVLTATNGGGHSDPTIVSIDFLRQPFEAINELVTVVGQYTHSSGAPEA